MNEENNIAPDTFLEYRLNFTIAEFLDIYFSERTTKSVGDLFCEVLRTGTGKYLRCIMHVKGVVATKIKLASLISKYLKK